MIAIKQVSKAIPFKSNSSQREIYRVIGTTDIDGKGTDHEISAIDPFIFLDEAIINEAGTTFSPHPHAGLAAVSHIFSGEIKAWDNLNGESAENNQAGGLYYINSGRGVVHSEIAAKPTHWLQLWLNPGVYNKPLPQAYAQLISPDLTPIYADDDMTIRVLMGDAYNCSSQVISDWPVLYMRVVIKANKTKEINLEHNNWNGFVYVIEGSGFFGANEDKAAYQNLLIFDTKESTSLTVSNAMDSDLVFMLALGKPHNKDFSKLLGHGGAVVADTEESAREAMTAFEADEDNFGK
ncbi:MAG: pirin family protein [Coxiellaceae bacterium]|nr:pirin family protein [Coxiellaceae bacterium]